jgi:hypothetical protein
MEKKNICLNEKGEGGVGGGFHLALMAGGKLLLCFSGPNWRKDSWVSGSEAGSNLSDIKILQYFCKFIHESSHSLWITYLTLCCGSYFFGYTAENSHHLKARIISKDPLFQEEKIPAENGADVM